MICPQCQAANPNGARFCYNCGVTLPVTCPRCEAAVVPGARFCHNCGQDLAGTPAPEARPDAPAELLARLEGARRRDEARPTADGERRIVTVLFADVRGSTALAEGLDPEEWAEVMNGAFECLIEPVYRYEGIVARLMGDGLLALFGAPVAHEDDPRRAVQAGLDIIAGVRAYSQRLRRERGLELAVRVGVNTGLAVVGAVGSDLRTEYTAMGDAVNLAARMQELARPGAVHVTGDTFRRVAPLFEAESLGQVEVRGKAEPVDVYRVLGQKATPGRLRGIEGLSAPLVGRERELAVLRRSLSGLRQGRGQIVCLLGEAGLGKSRLIDELRAESPAAGAGEAAPAEPLLWRESRSPTYAATLPYGAFRQLVRHLCGVGEDDSPQDIRDKIGCECVPAGTPVDQCRRVSRAFKVLLGVQPAAAGRPAEAPAARLEGEAFKNELFQSMLSTWRSWATARPTVLVFDDLHWADPASIELLIYLFQLVDEVPILFLCVFRPDRDAPSWQLKPAAERDYSQRFTEIVLRPLSAQESGVLVDSLLTVAALPPELRRLIQDKAEGNPFFVEEVIRELIEQGAIVHDEAGARWQAALPPDELRLSIPDNVQALIAARIDRLRDQARYTLQLASVIGRTFYYRVLQRVSTLAAGLDRELRELQRVDLVREQAREPELLYAFRHALTQEAAYNSILLKRRREFHRQVGEALEKLFPERMEEYAPQLAHHFYEARDPRALYYTVLAGDEAMRLYANAEAVCHFDRALEAAAWDGAGPADLHHIYLRRGRALELDTRYDQALDGYRHMEQVARDGLDRALELAAVMAQAVVHATPTPAYNHGLAQGLCDRALELARELGDTRSVVRILWVMMLLYHHEGDLEKSVANGEHALLLARELGAREELAFVLNDLNIVYLSLGDVQRSRAVGLEAQQLWRELGNQPMLVDSLAGAVGAEFFAGNYDRAVDLAEQADRLSQAIGNLWGQAYSRMYVGYVHVERGEFSRAIDVMETCLRLSKEAGFMAPLGMTQADLGLLYVRLGAVERGLDLLRAALAITEVHVAPWQPSVLAQLARAHIWTGHLGAAEALVREAFAGLGPGGPGGVFTAPISLARAEMACARARYAEAVDLADAFLAESPAVRAIHPEMLYIKGRALLGLGRLDAAWTVLTQARREARRLGARRVLWPVLDLLAGVEAQRGHPDRARALHCQAQEVVDYIGGHVDAAELRAAFLGLPHVQALAEAAPAYPL